MLIKFKNRPDGFYCDITGAIYKQIMPFSPVERDWNNDGDIYIEIVSVFILISDESQERDAWAQLPKKIVFNKWEWAEIQNDIEIISDK